MPGSNAEVCYESGLLGHSNKIGAATTAIAKGVPVGRQILSCPYPTKAVTDLHVNEVVHKLCFKNESMPTVMCYILFGGLDCRLLGASTNIERNREVSIKSKTEKSL